MTLEYKIILQVMEETEEGSSVLDSYNLFTTFSEDVARFVAKRLVKPCRRGIALAVYESNGCGEPEPLIDTSEIARARKIMADAFEVDPDFKQTYIANIAMLLYDKDWLKRPNQDRNLAAEAILDLIFDNKRILRVRKEQKDARA